MVMQEAALRKERSEKSMDSILKAAFRVIARESISGTSTSKIAAEAGVSKPLLHYHFNTKEKILENVLQHEVLEKLLEIPLENANKNLSAWGEIEGIFKRHKQAITGDPDLLVVFYDFWVQGVKYPEIRKIIIQRFDAFRGYVGQLVSEGMGRGEFTSDKAYTLPPVLLSFLEGASLQLISDPNAFNYDLYQYMALDMISHMTGRKDV